MTATPAVLASRWRALSAPEDLPQRQAEILAALEEESPALRSTAIAWAARCLHPADLAPLVALPDNAVLRNAAIAALTRQGPYAIHQLTGMLADVDPDVAMFACQALGETGAREAGPAILPLLSHQVVNVIQAAIEALGQLQTAEAVPALSGMLGASPWLQLAAAEALGAIGDARAVPALLELVPDSFVAEVALDALARIGSPESLPTMLAILPDPTHHALRGPLLRAAAAGITSSNAELLGFGKLVGQDRSAEGLYQYIVAVLRGEPTDPESLLPPPASDDRRDPRSGDPTLRAAATMVLAAEMQSLVHLVVRRAATRDSAAWIEPLIRTLPRCLSQTGRAMLGHPDPAVRQGLLAVAEFTLADAPVIAGLLNDDTMEVRAAAARALGRLRAGAAVPRLLDQLVHGSGYERDSAAQALGRMHHSDLEPVLGAYLQVDGNRALAARVLGIIERSGTRAFDAQVFQLAQATDPSLRRAALRVVVQIEGSRAEVMLFWALADRDQANQVEALNLLVARVGDRTLDTLLALLGSNDSLRYHVIRAIGRLGVARAAKPLEAAFGTVQLHEQLEIVAALATIATPGATEFLRRAATDPHVEIRRVAAQGMATLASEPDLPLLLGLADDSDWAIRNAAAEALGRLTLPEARETLLALARDLEPVVARTARARLGAFGK